MEEYITNLRNKGYNNWIQVFRKLEITNNSSENISWIDMSKPLSEQTKPGFQLIEIKQSFDLEERLDYIDLTFEEEINKNITVKEYRENSNINIERKEYYWKPIRKIIGKEKILAIGVNGFIQNEKGEIAAVKRKDDGNWSFPAGAREIGELPSETIVNEFKEETSLIAEATKLCGIYIGPLVYPNGDIYDYMIFLYRMKYISGDLKVNDHENLDAKWLSIEEATKLFGARWKKRLDFYKNYKDEDGVVIL